MTMTPTDPLKIEDIKAARHQQILDARDRHIDSLPRDAEGGCHYYPDELPGIISAILGENIDADELHAAERWEWEQAAGGKFPAVAAHAGGELEARVAEYKDALEELQKAYEHLVAHHTISVTAEDRDDDIFHVRWLGELTAQIELVEKFVGRMSSTLFVMRQSLERIALAPALVMNEQTRAAYRAVIESLDRAMAALGMPIAERSNMWGAR